MWLERLYRLVHHINSRPAMTDASNAIHCERFMTVIHSTYARCKADLAATLEHVSWLSFSWCMTGHKAPAPASA
jgi:hypothetical protein